MANKANDERALKIKELVEEMKLYNNPEEIEAVKKEIKQNVPFSMRGYLLAYLFITNKTTPAKKPANTRPEVKDAKSFFINVGKMSHAPARELAQFICTTAGIEDSDIVTIAYKQNYSFVYIKNDKADGIIEKVNGQTYRGRKVKINYSKETNEN